MSKAPGKSNRKGISLFQATQMFSTERKAEAWFVRQRWGASNRIRCPFCDSNRLQTKPNRKPQPWRCLECKKHFSVKTNSFMHASNIPLSKWGMAIYLFSTNLKGVSSMKLHRDLGITQQSAWHMAHRIRNGWSSSHKKFTGPVEVDEAYIGAREDRKHASKRKHPGSGVGGKEAIVGIKDRETNQIVAAHTPHARAVDVKPFVRKHTNPDTMLYTDNSTVYKGVQRFREIVRHSLGEYVRGKVHTNGIESFWASLKRGRLGVYHHFSVKHLQRYVNEFAGRHNLRPFDTEAQMGMMVRGGLGKQLRYIDLIGPRHTRQPRMI